MAHATTPHTQTQQNTKPERSDLDPDQLEQAAGRGSDADLYRNNEGAQAGANRRPALVPGAGRHLKSEPEGSAHEGQTTTRTPENSRQGITSHSAKEESNRQREVVKDRPDAKAGVNKKR